MQATVSNGIESKNNELALKGIATLEEKLEQALKANDALERELQVASKTIVRKKLLKSLEKPKIIAGKFLAG